MRPIVALTLLSLAASACGDNLTAFPQRQPYSGAAATPLACQPNLDGRIDAAELPVALHTPVTYLVSPTGSERSVDVVGEATALGTTAWDWSQAADDQAIELTAEELAGKWYAATFPQGQFVAAFDAAASLEAVYSIEPTGLMLHGLASRQEDPPEGQTLWSYGTPVTLYPLPLQAGMQWQSTGSVRNGRVRGIPYASDDSYVGESKAVGRLSLPDLSFTQAHRVDSHVTFNPIAGLPLSRRQVSFLFECFGEVARATSRNGEIQEDFTTAAEVRRLGLWP